MKNKLLFLLSILLCLSLVSCDKNPTTTDDISNTGGFIYLPTIETLEEYAEFVETNDVSKKIVLYDDISMLGEFDVFFVCDYLTDEVELIKHAYSLKDGANTFSLDIEPIGETETTNTVVFDKSQENCLLKVKKQFSGEIQLGEMRYHYINGNLYSLKWISGKWKFTLYSFSDYKQPKNETLISRLIYRDTAEEAFSEIQSAITGTTAS